MNCRALGSLAVSGKVGLGRGLLRCRKLTPGTVFQGPTCPSCPTSLLEHLPVSRYDNTSGRLVGGGCGGRPVDGTLGRLTTHSPVLGLQHHRPRLCNPSSPTCLPCPLTRRVQGRVPHPSPPCRREGRCLANEATVTTWTLGEEARTFRTSQHPQCGVMPMVRAVWGGEGDPRDKGYSHSPAAPGPWAWLRLAFCSRPRRAQSLAPRPEPPGTPGPFPSFPHSYPTPSICTSRPSPPPPGSLPGCAVSCKFLRLSVYPASGALYRESLEAGSPMGPQPTPPPLTRTVGTRGHTLEGSLEVVFTKLRSWGLQGTPPSQAPRSGSDGPPPARLSPARKFPVDGSPPETVSPACWCQRLCHTGVKSYPARLLCSKFNCCTPFLP